MVFFSEAVKKNEAKPKVCKFAASFVCVLEKLNWEALSLETKNKNKNALHARRVKLQNELKKILFSTFD